MNLDNYGKYGEGLTRNEIEIYLLYRAEKHTKYKSFTGKQLAKKFNQIAGINTMAFVDGQTLMYRHDVQRFADVMFLGKVTYFD